MLALCPSALFFNYSNPMTAVCRAIRKATGAPVTGLCHGVDEVGHYLAGQLGANKRRFSFEAVGLNHLTWFVKTEVDGRDAKPRLLEIARAKLSRKRVTGNLAENFLEGWQWQRGPNEPEELNPASWGFLETFGAFTAAMDRHVTEFFGGTFLRPGGYFGRTLGTESYSFERTIAAGDREFEIMREQALSLRPLDESLLRHSAGEHEQVIDIIESIRTNAGRAYSANLPNEGRFPNLPAEAIIEAPSVASAEGLRPVQATGLTQAQAAVIAQRLAWVELVVEAALEGSRAKFIQALVLDGSLQEPAAAEKLGDRLLAAHATHLPWYGRA